MKSFYRSSGDSLSGQNVAGVGLHPLEESLIKETVAGHSTISRRDKVSHRKSLGAFFTPPHLARYVLEKAINLCNPSPKVHPPQYERRILDPAVGAGVFLAEAVSIFKDVKDARTHLVGVDIEPRAVSTSRRQISKLIAHEKNFSIELFNENFLSPWEPPGGRLYNLIVGNPPWGLQRRPKAVATEFPDISLEFVARSLRFLRREGALGFLLPGTWLSSMSFVRFREFLLAQRRTIQITILQGRWFKMAAYTSDPVVLVLGPIVPSEDFRVELFLLEQRDYKTKVYGVGVEEIKRNTGIRIPVAPQSFHRFLKAPDFLPHGAARVLPAGQWGITSFAGLKTYKNSKFVFNKENAEKLCSKGNARIKSTLYVSEIKHGVKSDKKVLIPFGKGGRTIVEGEPTDFATPERFFVRWDEAAVREYSSRSGMRNMKLYFHSGINFSASGRYCPVFRNSIKVVFDADYPLIPMKEGTQWALLGLLNSPPCLFLAKHLINRTAHFKNQDLRDLPIPDPQQLPGELASLAKSLFEARSARIHVHEDWYRKLSDIASTAYGLSELEKKQVWQWYRDTGLRPRSVRN